MSKQENRREELVANMQSGNDELIVAAAKELLAMGHYGDPVGKFPLEGGKAALRLWRRADAVVLLYHGLKVAEPGTLVWGEILVNRAIACAHHGFYLDAIEAGSKFLSVVHDLPCAATSWTPFVHHALGIAYDYRKDFSQAAEHYTMAVEHYSEPALSAGTLCNLAYSLARSGRPAEADQALSRLDAGDLGNHERFARLATLAVTRYHQGRWEEALVAAEQAEGIGRPHSEAWGSAFPELLYWLSRSAWNVGNRYLAMVRGLEAAVRADEKYNIALLETTNAWLEEMLSGGLRSA